VEEKVTERWSPFLHHGKFIDFCRGPHIPSTKRIQAFKLMSVAGAYWKGQEGQSAAATHIRRSFFTHQRNSTNISTASKKPAARSPQAGPELDLFSIQEEADQA